MRKGKIFPAAIDKSFSCDRAGQKERNPHNMEIWEILLLIVGVWAAFEIVFSAIVFFAAFTHLFLLPEHEPKQEYDDVRTYHRKNLLRLADFRVAR